MNFEWEFISHVLARVLQIVGLIFTSAGVLGEVRLKRLERYNRIFRRRIKLSSFIQNTKPAIKVLFFIIFVAGFLVPMVYETRIIWLRDNKLEQVVSILTILSFVLGLAYLAMPQKDNLILASSTLFSLAYFGNYLFKYSTELFMVVTYSSFWIIIPLVRWLSSQALQQKSFKDYAALEDNPLNWKFKNPYSDDIEQRPTFWNRSSNMILWLNWLTRKFSFSFFSLTVWVGVKIINYLIALGLYGLLLPYKSLESFRLKLKLRGSVITIGIALSLAGILLD